MKKIFKLSFIVCTCIFLSCNTAKEEGQANAEPPSLTGQSGIKDDLSQKNVVQVAIASPEHTTLVKAVQAAELVDALSNAGPFTVFAPTDAAFAKLPAGTVEGLLAPEKKEELANILQYHVSLGVFKVENLTDGQLIGQVNGDNIVVNIVDGKIMLNESATIVASIPASNGMVHVIDGVLLPPK